MINDTADEVIEEPFQLILPRCQIRFETSLKSTDVIFHCVHLLYNKCHKNFVNWVDHINTVLIG